MTVSSATVPDEFDCVAWVMHQAHATEEWSDGHRTQVLGALVGLLSTTWAGRELYAEALSIVGGL